MSCAFDLAHYRELLDAAKAGGYRFATFEAEPQPGDVLLRHDVDLSLEAALELARLEQRAGARATYFLMTESVFYNLDSAARARRRSASCASSATPSACTRVYPRASRDDRFDAVLAWHNPDPEYVHEPVSGFVNVMQPPWFTKGKYRSDSNQHWREGCPHDELRAGAFEWLQLLVHPEIWVYEGSTMGETMRAMLEQKRGELARAPRERPDRPHRDDGSRHRCRRARHRRAAPRPARERRARGAPRRRRHVGALDRQASLRRVPSRAGGRQTPRYADAVLEIVEREQVDVVLPQSSFDLPGLAAARDRFPVPVLVSSPDTVHRSNDKAETYELLQRIGVPTVEFRRVAGARQVEAAAHELGYPDRPVCFKPVFSSGLARLPHPRSRPSTARTSCCTSVPGRCRCGWRRRSSCCPTRAARSCSSWSSQRAASARSTASPTASASCSATRRRARRCAPGSRCTSSRSRTTALMEIADKIVRELAIEWFFNIQLVGDRVIEINPRISTVVYQEDLNLPWLGVKRALGEISDDELEAMRTRVRPGRTALRYFDQVEWDQ